MSGWYKKRRKRVDKERGNVYEQRQLWVGRGTHSLSLAALYVVNALSFSLSLSSHSTLALPTLTGERACGFRRVISAEVISIATGASLALVLCWLIPVPAAFHTWLEYRIERVYFITINIYNMSGNEHLGLPFCGSENENWFFDCVAKVDLREEENLPSNPSEKSFPMFLRK